MLCYRYMYASKCAWRHKTFLNIKLMYYSEIQEKAQTKSSHCEDVTSYPPSLSTSRIMARTSWSVWFWPSEFITVFSSLAEMWPSLSLSNSANASLNSAGGLKRRYTVVLLRHCLAPMTGVRQIVQSNHLHCRACITMPKPGVETTQLCASSFARSSPKAKITTRCVLIIICHIACSALTVNLLLAQLVCLKTKDTIVLFTHIVSIINCTRAFVTYCRSLACTRTSFGKCTVIPT